MTFPPVTSECFQRSRNIVPQKAGLARTLPHRRAGDSELSRNVNGIPTEASDLVCHTDG